MSELSALFVRLGTKIESELTMEDGSTRLRAYYNNCCFVAEFLDKRNLMLSVGKLGEWQKALPTIQQTCTQYMGAEPICAYDAQFDPGFWNHFVEWDEEFPEESLRTLVNLGGSLALAPVENMQALGGYQLSDYEDPALKRAYRKAERLRSTYPGVYGKDPGYCNGGRVLIADELGLFLECSALLCVIFHMKCGDQAEPSDEACLRILRSDLVNPQTAELDLALDFIAYQICRKAGIRVLEEPSSERRLRVDAGELSRWFCFFSAHFAQLCPTLEAGERLLRDYCSGKDISAYEPSGNWRTS